MSHGWEDRPQAVLHDIQADPWQENPLQDAGIGERMEDLLIETMRHHDAPACNYPRVGMKAPDDAPGDEVIR
ncbi:MAG: hypothetical protein ACLFVU_10670 [Phycisphaerae bacterium]